MWLTESLEAYRPGLRAIEWTPVQWPGNSAVIVETIENGVDLAHKWPDVSRELFLSPKSSCLKM